MVLAEWSPKLRGDSKTLGGDSKGHPEGLTVLWPCPLSPLPGICWSLQAIRMMKEAGLRPNTYCMNSLMAVNVQARKPNTALEIFKEMERDGIPRDVVSERPCPAYDIYACCLPVGVYMLCLCYRAPSIAAPAKI